MKISKFSAILPVFAIICSAMLFVGCGEKTAQDAPVLEASNIAVDYSARTITINLDELENIEYSVDNGANWQIEKTFSNLTSGAVYQVVVRYAETSSAYASENSNAISVAMKNTNVIPPTLQNSDVTTSGTTITINPSISGVEYSIDNGTTWQLGNVFENLTHGQAYSVVIRYKETETNLTSEKSNAITVTVCKEEQAAPQLNGADVIVDGTTITVLASYAKDIEYTFDGGLTWGSENTFNGVRGTTYKVAVRYVASGCYNASSASNFATVAIEKLTRNETFVDSDITTNGLVVTIKDFGATATYSFDGGVTYSTTRVKTLTANTTYQVLVKIAADSNYAEWLGTRTVKIGTQSAPTDIDLAVSGTTVTASVASTEKEVEYSIDGTIWVATPQFEDCVGTITVRARFVGSKYTLASSEVTAQVVIWDGETVDTEWYDSESSEFEISNANELAGLASLVNGGNSFAGKTILLTNDIYLGGADWMPIGVRLADMSFNFFSGTLDGGENTIYDLTIELAYYMYGVGLFGNVSNASISNLSIANVNIEAAYGAGAFVGRCSGDLSLSNLHTLGGEIVFWDYCGGGIIGEVDYRGSGEVYDIEISNCSNSANISSKFTEFVANTSDAFKTAYVAPTDTTYYDYLAYDEEVWNVTGRNAGGIWGSMNEQNIHLTVSNCVNSGNITVVDYAGGIAGFVTYASDKNVSGTITDCVNTGTLTTFITSNAHTSQTVASGVSSNVVISNTDE